MEGALQEVEQMQKEAVDNFQQLNKQHQEWQKKVDAFLMCVRSSVEPLPIPVAAPSSRFPSMSSEGGMITNLDDSISSRRGKRLLLQKDPVEDSGSVRHRQREAAVGGAAERPMLALSQSFVENFQISEGGPLRRIVAEMLEDQPTANRGRSDSWWDRLRTECGRLVKMPKFEYVTGFLILLNMVTIGIEAETSTHGEGASWVTTVEQIFLALYTLELTIRLMDGGWACFRSFWFLMDFFLVFIGMIGLLIVPMMGSGSILDGFEKVLVVRGMRLLRLVRALRMVNHFKVMWRLVSSLLTAGSTMLSTTALLVLSLFIFGCMAVELITHSEHLNSIADTRFIVERHFPNLFTSILTLLQFVTLDSIAAVYSPLIREQPILVFYFALILLTISIGLMNLVTAVLVENALENAAVEAESERLQLKKKVGHALPQLLKTFQELDKDQSGSITREEIEGVPVSVIPGRLLENVSIDSMVDLFELLDEDGGGSLTQQEFVEGLLNLVLMDMPITTIQSLRLLRSIKSLTSSLTLDIKSLRGLLLEVTGYPVHL